MANSAERFAKLLALPRPILLDGAMGTLLLARELPSDGPIEALNITHPDEIREIHKKYLRAGSDIIYTNTFGANPIKLHGSGLTCEQVIDAALSIARDTVNDCENEHACVALDIGPLGEMLESDANGFERVYGAYAEVARCADKFGADIIALETMSDLQEVRAAMIAIKDNTDIPMLVTMTFDSTGHTFSGCTPESFAYTATALGAAAIGVNCSVGPDALYDTVSRICSCTNLPVVVKPNAGLPDMNGDYSISAIDFAQKMRRYADMGVKLMGGCCGSTPEYIAELRTIAYTAKPVRREVKQHTIVCSAHSVVTVDNGVHIVGESINPTGKKQLQQALLSGDYDYILRMALSQEKTDADMLDVNVGFPGVNESAVMRDIIPMLQSVTPLPLSIDTTNTDALEVALRAYCGVALVNSTDGDDATLERILPLVKKYGACVVVLTLDQRGIPDTVERRIEIAKHIIARAAEYGIDRHRVIIDCLTLTASAQQSQAERTLRAVSMVRDELGLCTILGISNISFGLPERRAVNRTFLALAIANGLNLAILNPDDSNMTDTVYAANVLYNLDEGSTAYMRRMLDASRVNVRTNAVMSANAPEKELSQAITSGLKARAGELAERLLDTFTPLDLVNQVLIPALDDVGDLYAKEKIFLPQLLQAASAAQSAFERVRLTIARSASPPVSRGRIILATVRGDIHDIGKNIVKVVLENYGYNVIDLGHDVPEESVVKAAIDNDAVLVGLSALMTTTLPAMRRTIELLRASGHECKIMIGGAVLTPEYALELGADFYAKDAHASAKIAKQVLG